MTGSMHLVRTDQSQVILDCGLFQGRREDFYKFNTRFPFCITDINGLILSHAHIDHSGNIPTIVKNGLTAPIYATSATVDLCGLMLPDSGHIQEEDVKFVNKINRRKGLPLRFPLYTENDARESLSSFRGMDYHQPIKITNDITCTFYESGHVLGSAISVLDIKNEKHDIRLAYAVDLGRKNLPLLKDPEVVSDIDYLIIESTYGNRQHDSMETVKGKLAEVVNRTVKRGGKIIIPSFAFERTQEVAYFLNALVQEHKIPSIPIFVDSPLATNITMIFQANIKYLDETTQDMMRRQMDPFGFSRIQYIRDADKSRALNMDNRPMVIISASGMCEAGRILHHLKNNIENPANTILVVGYMAQDTLGKKIVDRSPIVRIFGEEHHLKAEVVKINAFSAHADKNELMEYIGKCNKKLKRIFVVHGDDEQSEPFIEKLKQSGYKADLPSRGDEVLIG